MLKNCLLAVLVLLMTSCRLFPTVYKIRVYNESEYTTTFFIHNFTGSYQNYGNTLEPGESDYHYFEETGDYDCGFSFWVDNGNAVEAYYNEYRAMDYDTWFKGGGTWDGSITLTNEGALFSQGTWNASLRESMPENSRNFP